jgi:hypothetical protein
MKRSLKKLSLNRETLRKLTEERLTEAAGGATLSCNTQCQTRCFACPSQNTQCNTGCLPCDTQTGCVQTFTC